ncbi:hypothetical protein A2757_00425 [Candidatus Giovannonibacteria bacterium RIFCSPHIGHO2_01_FULL_48_47]|nr:MAG: hypothetical protein A2757_00425 [Candidatus Giovannonibacteria bacterium RIFCSPHIGHO2_01_FULL_48_47]OGF68369.1 MAG: hypothetical protein A3D61_00605 [Candidatus Giovannonibacteria bacterium RIFCSPHIGHO2_02_FULL_48_15]OGF96176.1 MAG: hypothetical protein A2613_01245 [Candidatus Giovannonibacteria bacterium RIFOXYD1_FULL_48_21]HBT81626.1 hypothetical protein [Candidatus Giovannonibacteria bacterium]
MEKLKVPALIFLAALYLAALFLYAAVLVPRPYYIQTTDLENDYYYNARLMYRDLPSYFVQHPGTPLYYFLSKLMLLAGDDLADTQRFLDLGYLFLMLFNFSALLIFIWFILKHLDFGVSFFLLALVMSFPSFLTYQNYLGSDAVIVALGLPLASLIWILLSKEKKPVWFLVLGGILFGFVIAIKYSFLLLIIPLWFSLLFSAFLNKNRAELRVIFSLPFLALGAFLVFVSPVLYRLPAIINSSLLRDNIASSGLRYFLVTLGSNIYTFLTVRPIFVFTILALIFIFLITLVDFIMRRRNESAVLARSSFSFLGICALAYSLVSLGDISSNLAAGEELGVIVRNTAPALVILPFLAQITLSNLPNLGSTKWRFFLAALGVLLLIESISGHVLYRNRLIQTSLAAMEETEKELNALIPDGKYAIWTTDSKYAYGEASFHYWGNHRHALNAFDEELTQYFGEAGFFHFRTAGALLDAADYPLPEFLQKHQRLSNLYLWWRKTFPPIYEPTRDIVTGESRNEPPAVIMFPESEREIPEERDPELLRLIEKRFKVSAAKNKISVRGRDWTIITLVKD